MLADTGGLAQQSVPSTPDEPAGLDRQAPLGVSAVSRSTILVWTRCAK